MSIILAYGVWGQDNGGYYYREAPDEVFCPDCGSVIDRDYTPRTLGRVKPIYDVASTYDNHSIVSLKFKEFCERARIKDLDFIKVNESPLVYDLRPRLVLEFDAARTKIRFENRCQTCNQFESVVGPIPGFLKGITSPIENGIYSTDIEFGSGREKNPLKIVGVKTMEHMHLEKFKGAEFIAVES